ncbi:MAG: IMPACT family protein, partial [Exilispira sp.]
MDFLTIKNEYFSELIVKKSRFIANIFPCTKSEDFKNKYDMIKKKFFDATHIIPVYRILESNNRIKEHFSDDREPAKTAGWPILYILQQKSLIQIGVLVIRYFGGIKLGTSGLTKAYSQVVLN